MAQMIDLEKLSVAIQTAINNSAALADIHGKTAFDYIARGVAKPKCRYSVIYDDLKSAYGTNLFPSVQLQFSVFADDMSSAQVLSSALSSLFKNSLLTLSDGQKVMTKAVKNAGIRKEGDEDKEHIVYHVFNTFEFIFL